jgi:hypothetical protein
MAAGEASEALLVENAVCDPHHILVFYGTIALGADLDHVWHFLTWGFNTLFHSTYVSASIGNFCSEHFNLHLFHKWNLSNLS